LQFTPTGDVLLAAQALKNKAAKTIANHFDFCFILKIL
jgi:hypothetical protein